jgi:hypothetical protein
LSIIFYLSKEALIAAKKIRADYPCTVAGGDEPIVVDRIESIKASLAGTAAKGPRTGSQNKDR